MIQDVVLSLKGQQTYMGQEPDVIELVTDGTLEKVSNGWKLSYEESALTGLEGVQTTFMLEEGCVTLTRTGKLNSQMIFREGVSHESLYQMEFGALMISVCATAISWELSQDGGTVDLKYKIEIEQSAAGYVDYHLEIRSK
ncbi:MAG: DUF1934 domain-containing protein [Oscillospiraceae bacterium]|nr:DUF1934 domain-containing protein [Oscillospiraceae bacterium]